jgi:hypothetical protein
MGRSIIRCVLSALLIAALLAPVVEAFDSWDATPGLASDTEFNVAALALVTGLFAVVAFAAVRASLTRASRSYFRLPAVGRMLRGPVLLPFFHGCSPPGVPLRI